MIIELDLDSVAAGTLDDRAIGVLVGLAVGDAIGTTLEFEPRDSYPPLTDMIGGGPCASRPAPGPMIPQWHWRSPRV